MPCFLKAKKVSLSCSEEDMPGTTKKATGGAYGQSILGLLMVCLGAM